MAFSLVKTTFISIFQLLEFFSLEKVFVATKSWLQCVFSKYITICDALRDLAAFAQFKKREKHPWRSVNFSKVSD